MHSIKPSAKQKIQVKKQRSTTRKLKDGHLLFWPVLLVVFLIWVAYRYLTSFPVWFDETLGKAVFFGLPIWFYVISTGFRSVAKLFQPEKFWKGVFLGLALGGVFGFFVHRSWEYYTQKLYAVKFFWHVFAGGVTFFTLYTLHEVFR